MQTACSFSFNIAAWNAVSSRVASAEQWQQWAAGRLDAESLPEYKPALSFLPAMQRRRLGLSGPVCLRVRLVVSAHLCSSSGVSPSQIHG